MEKIFFDVIRPYLIDRPDIAIIVVCIIFSISYIRNQNKMCQQWLGRHDDKLERSEKINTEILERISNIEGRLEERTKRRPRKSE